MPLPSQGQSPNATRRGVLLGGSALAFASFVSWPKDAAAATTNTDAFVKLSEKLTGKQDLYPETAAKFLEAFRSAGKGSEIDALAEGADNEELANEIVAAWYSGVSPDPDSDEVVTYTDALMWEAMSFSKPMGYCGGEMGYWAEPPAG
ncbi:sugar dehydrogenase complex small subunit [Hoeflea sp.]|uniref:sugar dehydrogenase complex small subunit n=1 Tax=Hoeflea sp. TaxID=1940281 RepID=UPI003A904A5B